MCAINPVHKKRILVDFYTSDKATTKEKFDDMILSTVLKFEQKVNATSRIRCHVKETTQEAD